MTQPEARRRQLVARLDHEMEEIYHRAKREVHYPATRFLQMVKEDGGLTTAHRLLEPGQVSYGLAELFLLGRPDLSVEALALKPEFEEVFTRQELATARERLGRKEG